tara:strand:- start:3 stop:554 length:552 start_codon:yes stop_codon:yes gene_type:complete
MTSELRVDKIKPVDGIGTDSGTEPGGTASQLTYGGGIIQIVQFCQGLGQVNSPNSNQFDTGLTCTITPKFNTSKILVQTTQPFLYNSDTAQGFRTFLLRGSTIITMHETYASGGGEWKFGSHNMLYLDSPATTSAVTYKTQGQNPSSSGHQLYNYNWQAESASLDNLTGYGTRSTMILMEVSA